MDLFNKNVYCLTAGSESFGGASPYRTCGWLVDIAMRAIQSAISPLTPSVRGESLPRNEPLFFEFESGKAVHHGRWKLVRSRDTAGELDNLETDRTETNDLADVHPDRVSGLSAAWVIWYKRCTGKDDAK